MREILFKAKGQTDDKWHIGFLANLYGGICIIRENEHEWICKPETICQYTGLNDKNGKLIWENDIVKCVDVNAETEFFAVVEFGNPNGFYSWGYQLKHIWGDEPNLDILLWIDMEEAGATCEIIGNIFDEGSENIGKRAEEN